MKLTSLLLLVTIFNVFGTKSYAQNVRLCIDIKDVPLKEVLNSIESQSNFFFLYSSKMIDVNQKVDIKVDDKKITEVLDKLLEETDINYIVRNQQILLVDKHGEEAAEVARALEMQQKTISGIVTGADGEPLPGVNVMVTGTTVGALTGIDGRYSFVVPDGAKSITFSFIGMVSQEINIGTSGVLNATMVESAIGLSEVIVVGYGTTKKISLTGSVSAVGSDELKGVSKSNLVTNLAGKLPGFRVTQRSGQPGGFTTSYDIRGLGTPLIVVNGIVTDGSDFVRIDPENIEQISILKDASAAVYGVKAANGVVLVTTKQGQIGKPTITYTGSYTRSSYVAYPAPASAYEYAWALTQSEINQGAAPGSTTFSPADLQSYKDGTNQYITDWWDAVMGKFAPSSKQNLSISGGTDRITYMASLGATNEVGIWKSRDLTYKRYNLRTSFTGKVTKNLTVDVSMDGMFDFSSKSSLDGDIGESIWVGCLPTKPIYANNNPDYFSTQATFGHNAIAEAESDVCGYINNRIKTLQGTIGLKYNFSFIKGLDAQVKFGYYNRDSYQKSWAKEWSTYDYDAATNTYIKMGSINSPSTLSGTYNPLNRTTALAQVNYNRTFAEKHSLKTSLIFEERYSINDNLQATKQFAIDIDQFYAGVANPTVTSSSINEDDNQSVIGRVNYDYLTKYLLEVGFNYNGSSKFPEGHRWGFFPYASAGWRISEEDFFKDRLPLVSNLKIRGSYGIMGDDAASKYQYLSGYNYPSSNFVIDGIIVKTLGFRGIPNPNISWYTVQSKNIGLDLSIRNGLINFSLDLFRRDRSGLLATRILTMPGTVGAALSQENLNKDMRNGFEVVLGHAGAVGSDLHYEISANFTYSRGQRTYVERSTDGNSYLNWKNNTTDRWDDMVWGYKYIGQFQNQEEINTSPLQDSKGNKSLQPGDYKYEDVNKDGVLNSDDQLPLFFSTVPDINASLSGSISYKSFDLNIFVQGAADMTQIIEGSFDSALPWNRNFLAFYADAWHHEDIYDVSSPWIPGKYASPKTDGAVPSNSWRSSTVAINSNYLRLKSLEIGYTLKKAWASKIQVENLRIYASGFNLLTFSKVKNFDPEESQSRLYPISRDITIGISAKF